MKTRLTTILLCAFTFLLASCSSGSPESTVKRYVKSIGDRDFVEAQKCATGSMAESLTVFVGASDEILEELKPILDMMASIEVLSSKIDGNTAVVQIEGMGQKGEFELKNVDGLWLITDFD